MDITTILKPGRQALSFEIFPPKTDRGMDNLFKELGELARFKPDFISVTYGAGGSTRDKTLDIALSIQEKFNIPPLAHFTCVGSGQDDIQNYITRIREAGINSILALRGDPPAGQDNFTPAPDGFSHANELVQFIRKFYNDTIAVAGYPEGHVEAPSFDADIENLKKKVDAGADFIITQLFFDNQDLFRYLDVLAKNNIDIPVIPGIMPITGITQIERSIELSGARIPRGLQELIDRGYSDDEFFKAGCQYTVNQCQELLDAGTAGFHFYTLNKAAATGAILNDLDFRNR